MEFVFVFIMGVGLGYILFADSTDEDIKELERQIKIQELKMELKQNESYLASINSDSNRN